MTGVHRSALLPYPTAAVFEIVDDVRRYPEFLPWCSSASILERKANEVVAALSLQARGVTETCTTRNLVRPFERIDVELVSGPFRKLSGGWTFTRLGNDEGCSVELALDFELKGVRWALGSAFGRAADQMVDAFCTRANELLG